MQTRQMIKNLGDLLLIEQFIQRGARVPIIKAQFPHIPESPVRELYLAIHGHISKRGLTPLNTLTINKSHDQILQANAFYMVYKSVGGREIFQTLNPETLIEAYDQYKVLNMEADSGGDNSLSFIAVWYVARDVRAKIVEVSYCRKCGGDYLYALVDEHWHNCPYCKTARRGKGRARRAATKQNRIVSPAPV